MSNVDCKHNRDFIYTIPQTVLLDLSLHLSDLRVYAIVRSFMDTTGDAYPGNAWIAQKLGVKKRTVQSSLQKLEEKGYMRRVFDEQGGRHLITGKPIPESFVSSPKDDLQITPPRSTDHPPHDLQITQLDQRSITSKIINNVLEKDDQRLSASKNDLVNMGYINSLFDVLWHEYPLKKTKQRALEALAKKLLGKTTTEANELVKAIWEGLKAHISEHKTMSDLKKQGADIFVPNLPHLATWIKQERWEDEYKTPSEILNKAERKKNVGIDLAARERRVKQFNEQE